MNKLGLAPLIPVQKAADISLLKKAISLIKSNRYPEAISLLNEYIKTDSTNHEARNYLALAYLKTEDYNHAEKVMKEAIKLKLSSEYYTNLGLISTKMGFINDAVKAFKNALELNPSNEKAKQYLMKYQKK